MNGRAKALLVVAAALILGLLSTGHAQDDGRLVTLILLDGTAVPFTLNPNSAGGEALYHDGVRGTSYGAATVDVGGVSTVLPMAQVARADLVSPGTSTRWRFTLRDGRTFDGFIGNSDAAFWVNGRNQFGATQRLQSFPRDPQRQPFISVIFDPAATAPGQATTSGGQAPVRADADNVNLRNGDILSGTILTGEFTIQASYGTLTFAKDQLRSITVENVAGRTDQALLKVGDRVSGVLQNTSIQMTLTSGATITLEKGNIASITFATER
jgi:hypothetical protein